MKMKYSKKEMGMANKTFKYCNNNCMDQALHQVQTNPVTA